MKIKFMLQAKASSFIFVAAIAWLSDTSFALSTYDIRADDEDAFTFSSDVLEGETVAAESISLPSFIPIDSCFGFVYKLRVTRSFKGQYRPGDVISVGFFDRVRTLNVGEGQIVFLRKTDKHFYDSCWFVGISKEFKKTDMYVPYSRKEGLFRIFTDQTGNKRFKSESCWEHGSLMFEEYFFKEDFSLTKEMKGSISCDVLTGPYDKLVNKILDFKKQEIIKGRP